jgi:hypothetical protein
MSKKKIDHLIPKTKHPATKPGKKLGRAEQKSTTIYLYYGPSQYIYIYSLN